MLGERSLTCVVADDESVVRARIVRLAREAGLDVVGEAADGAAAGALIGALRPDIVFLDIRMPGPSGLDVLAALDAMEVPPAVVLVTAYGEHALAAFALAAVDYVVKPVEHDRFAQAVARARAVVLGREARAALARAQAALGAERPDRLSFRAGGAILSCPLSEVRAFHAADDYVEAELPGRRPLLSVRMDTLEAALPSPPFLRIHRSHLVNLDHAAAIRTEMGRPVMELATGAALPVARARLAGVRQYFEEHSCLGRRLRDPESAGRDGPS
jgi:two-component system, LytTR family, response regulator